VQCSDSTRASASSDVVLYCKRSKWLFLCITKVMACRDVPDIRFRLARYLAVFQHPVPALAEKL